MAASNKSVTVLDLPLACSNELAAVEFMEKQRWGSTPLCPRCESIEVAQMKAKDGSRNARFLWRCRGCKKQFTVRVGTIMEDSPIPLRCWNYAFWKACASKKGVSAMQIRRETGLSYKSALFMMHRIRWAMKPANDQDTAPLTGTVEVDETFVGGKPRGRAYRGRVLEGQTRRVIMGPAPDFKDRKTPVFAAVERGGRVKARVIPNVTPKTLKQHVRELVDPSARLMTDQRIAYKGIGREFKGGHFFVNHSHDEWVRGDVTTNTIESFFAILKRGVVGTFHSVSRKHLPKYLSEFQFRYNTRKLDDGQRTALAIRAADGKRLTYAAHVA